MYRVLLLSGDNMVLSAVAEGYFRLFSPGDTEVYGAGIEVSKVDPLMLKLLKDDGVETKKLRSYSISELKHIDFDYILTFDEESETASHHLPSRPVKYHYHFDKYPKTDTGEQNEDFYLSIRNRVKKIIRSFVNDHFQDTKGK